MQRQHLQKLYDKKVKMPMLSQTGKLLQKLLMIDDVYATDKLSFRKITNNHQKDILKKNQKKTKKNTSYSPFKTVARDNRDSYLLRVTNQPNTNTNYQVNYNTILNDSPKYSLNKSNFIRRIYQHTQSRYKNPEQIQINKANLKKRCRKSVQQTRTNKPLNATDCMNWRKTYHNLDFKKQTDYKKQKQYQYTTAYKTFDINQLKSTKQHMFNNQQMFSMKPQAKKAHDFNSNQGHKYFSLMKSTNFPVYDLQATNWNRVKRRWNGVKTDLKFDRFRNKIIVKQDRSQQQWNPKLQYYSNYNSVKNKIHKTIDFNKQLNRRQNILPNKYPIKLAQRMDYGQRRYEQLNQTVKQRLSKTFQI